MSFPSNDRLLLATASLAESKTHSPAITEVASAVHRSIEVTSLDTDVALILAKYPNAELLRTLLSKIVDGESPDNKLALLYNAVYESLDPTTVSDDDLANTLVTVITGTYVPESYYSRLSAVNNTVLGVERAQLKLSPTDVVSFKTPLDVENAVQTELTELEDIIANHLDNCTPFGIDPKSDPDLSAAARAFLVIHARAGLAINPESKSKDKEK